MSSAQVHNQRRLKRHIPPYQGLYAETIKLNFLHLPNYTFFLYTPFARYFLETKSFSLTDEARATPVQDTAQRRHRRRRAVGTRCKDSFQIKTLRKPFLLSLAAIHPLVSSTITKEEAGVLALAASEVPACTWTLGA